MTGRRSERVPPCQNPPSTILRVQEIRSYDAPTRIASAPHFIKGVVNLRGVIVPIV